MVHIISQVRGGLLYAAFLLHKGVLIGDTLEVVLRMVNDLATVFGTVDRTCCFWNITLSGLVYYYLDLVGGVVEYLGDLFAGNRWTPRTFSHRTVVCIGRSGMTYRYRTLEYGVCLAWTWGA